MTRLGLNEICIAAAIVLFIIAAGMDFGWWGTPLHELGIAFCGLVFLAASFIPWRD